MFLKLKNRHLLKLSVYLTLFFTLTGVMFLRNSSQFGLGGAFMFREIDGSFWPSLKPMYNSTSENQTTRHARVERVCSAFQIPAKAPRRLFYFNKSIVYARVNKCATTYTIVTLQKLLYGKKRIKDNREFTWISDSPLPDLQTYINSLFSFFFVREPYGRLFSTFSNKFYMSKEHWGEIGPDIIRRYRPGASQTSLKYGHDVTFREMIQYTVDAYVRGQQMDVHVTPMHKLARPCGVKYTYIGKIETLEADWQNMVAQWKAAGIVNQNVSLSDKTFDREQFGEIDHLYKTIKVMNQSNVPVYNFFLRTWTYYQITGRISNHFPMPFDKNTFVYTRLPEFRRLVRDAMEKTSQLYPEETRRQKREALLQAYSTIPRQLLERLRHVLLTDCRMFGYDDRPDWLFNMHTPTAGFEYFKWS